MTTEQIVEMLNDENKTPDCIPEEATHNPVTVDQIRAIQLDALREGMHRAAKLIKPSEVMTITEYQDRDYYHNIILTAAEQLTEKDLTT